MRCHMAVSEERLGPGSVTRSVRASAPAGSRRMDPSPVSPTAHSSSNTATRVPGHSFCSESPTAHGLDNSADTVVVPRGSKVPVGSVPGLVADSTSSGDGNTEPPKLCQPGS